MDMRKTIEATGLIEDPDGPDLITTVTATVVATLSQTTAGGQVTWGIADPVHVIAEEDGSDLEPILNDAFPLCELTAYQRRLLDEAILEWVIDEQLSTGGA
jgi:hypothetical protein